MSISLCLRKSLITLTALGLMGLPFTTLQAEESLDSWISNSNRLVDKYMTYPHWAFRRGDTGESYIRVTIDGNGEVLKSEIIGKSGSRRLDLASLKVVKKIKQFPPIPASRFGDEMTFGVKLRYDIVYPGEGYREIARKTKVTMKELQTASNSPMSAEIVIFDTGN